MRKLLLGLFCLIYFSLASAETINFDDLAGDLSPVPDGYKGLNWNSSNASGVVDVNPYLVAGVDYTGIKDSALFNAFGYLAPNITIISAANGSTFDFISGFWSAGLAGNVDIFFEGYFNNQLVYTSQIFNLTGTSVSPIALNWTGLSSLRISSSPSIWIADNLNINVMPSPVPEPPLVWMLCAGIVVINWLRKRYKY